MHRHARLAVTIPLTGLLLTALSASGTSAAAPPSTEPPTIGASVPLDGGVASPDALHEAGVQSSGSSYRVELFMEMSGVGFSIDSDAPVLTGTYAGADGRSHMIMDFGVMVEDVIPAGEMPAELVGRDLTMEFVTDGTDVYIRAPFLAALADAAGDESIALLPDLGDGWGYVDGSRVPWVDAAAVGAAMGGAGADPSALFELLADVKGAQEIGTEVIRGVETTGVRAEVSLADLMAVQSATLPADFVAADVTFPIEVWVDGNGFVRRITFNLNGDDIAEAAATQGEEIPSNLLGAVEISMTMEMFDYGAADIQIDVPTDFVDVTDDFLELVPQNG